MAQHVRPAELVLAATIARRFYLDGRSKIELADEFGLSRFKVARILNDAREQGLVHVDIRLPGTIDAELSTELGSELGLRRTIVIDTPPEPEASLRRHLAEITADLLTEIVTDDDVLGLTWSRTIEETSLALTRLAPCTVVQLAGTLAHPDRDTSTVEVVRQAASVGGGRAYPIYAPLIVPDAATAAALRSESRITDAMSRFEGLTKAVIAVGAWTPHHSTVWDAVTPAEREECLARGACAEVSGRLLDAEGNALRTDLDERVIAITLDQLRAVPEVVAIAAGAGRAAAAAAVVRAGFVDTLVTDASLAQAVLGQDHDPPRGTQTEAGRPAGEGAGSGAGDGRRARGQEGSPMADGSRSMRAAVLHAPHEIVVEERPVPRPEQHEVLVRVGSVGLCGSDVHYYEHGRIGDHVVRAPMVLGHEASGEVVGRGDRVTRHHLGQRVSLEPGVPCLACSHCLTGRYNLCPRMRFFATPPVDGAFCEYVVLHEAFAHPVPDTMSDDSAALLEPLSVGVWACTRARIGKGSRVLVTGSGPVGLVAMQTALALRGGRGRGLRRQHRQARARPRARGHRGRRRRPDRARRERLRGRRPAGVLGQPDGDRARCTPRGTRGTRRTRRDGR